MPGKGYALVSHLEGRPMSWRLRSHILHRAGYTNTGGHWHPAKGAARTRVKRLGGIRSPRSSRRSR